MIKPDHDQDSRAWRTIRHFPGLRATLGQQVRVLNETNLVLRRDQQKKARASSAAAATRRPKKADEVHSLTQKMHRLCGSSSAEVDDQFAVIRAKMVSGRIQLRRDGNGDGGGGGVSGRDAASRRGSRASRAGTGTADAPGLPGTGISTGAGPESQPSPLQQVCAKLCAAGFSLSAEGDPGTELADSGLLSVLELPSYAYGDAAAQSQLQHRLRVQLEVTLGIALADEELRQLHAALYPMYPAALCPASASRPGRFDGVSSSAAESVAGGGYAGGDYRGYRDVAAGMSWVSPLGTPARPANPADPLGLGLGRPYLAGYESAGIYDYRDREGYR
ncbi:hypothetical protein B484DRAFT_404974 [Ochromonadaceae sp. CCMP2298]|nr:hypothetical protein B484DRAFT_404974 [Ochromonadaceae sp. CCMP2298]|mmetsp:Transcript_24898/g.56212  ORF Transcript_24898/g.56212 Transcript_24898/m.56212 type:complete len:333 (-) Transcript_24898:229-1227(-)